MGDQLTANGVNVLSELANKQTTLDSSSVVPVFSLSATGEVVSDTMRALSASAVTVADNLAVEGELTVEGTNVVQALAAREPAFTAVAPLSEVFSYDEETDTGQLELRLDTSGMNPYWCAGVVGADTSVLSSHGLHGFSVSRPQGFDTGVYKITFDTPAPYARYVITLTQQGSGSIKIWDSTEGDRKPTTQHFHAVSYGPSGSLANFEFHFSVFV